MARTPQQVIDLVAAFEQDLADFYGDLPLKAAFKPLEPICRFMSRHSAIHAQLIANYRSNAGLPGLRLDPLTILHDRLKTSLRDELAATGDIDQAAAALAQTEAVIGAAYARIAAHYAELSDIYRIIAGKFDALAKDEISHRDCILRERSRITGTAAASASESDS